jgi:hypothetical protein
MRIFIPANSNVNHDQARNIGSGNDASGARAAIASRQKRRWLELAVALLIAIAMSFSAIAQQVCDGAYIADGSCVAQTTEELLSGEPEANEGTFEGGVTGTFTDAAINNVLPEALTDDGGSLNIPSGGPPSPLFGAESFTQQMLRFEEIGPGALDGQDRRRFRIGHGSPAHLSSAEQRRPHR